MKTVKMLVMIGAVVSAGQCFAVSTNLWKVSLTGTQYAADTNSEKIVSDKISSKLLISDCTTNKGAQLVWVTPINQIRVVDKCGNLLCAPIVSFGTITGQTVVKTGVKGTAQETIGTATFTIPGGTGTAICDLKTRIDSKGTNITGKCSGIFNSGGEPGVVNITVSGPFKPASDCLK
jgi:hypothetical protein